MATHSSPLDGNNNVLDPRSIVGQTLAPAEARVLVVEDEIQERSSLADMITSFGYHSETACDGEEALAKIAEAPFDVIVTDLRMPRLDGFELLTVLNEKQSVAPAIVLTGFGNINHAVTLVRELGAFWFLEKPAQPAVLAALLERAKEYGRMTQEVGMLEHRLAMTGALGQLEGSSEPMKRVYSLIRRAAPTNASVLITGESGTGKERVARTLHALSPRKQRPFVAINCAALPGELIESELFGHEKGAFTGATDRHPGSFEQANGGTLFLDEIGEMPPGMQAKLLRVLEESKVRRLGGAEEIHVDVRVIAATNRPLDQAIRERVLREDLYYRLNVFCVALPPLRQRREDIPVLADAILAELNSKNSCNVQAIHLDAIRCLTAYSWPGNVRELRNALEWAVITAGEGTLLQRHLPAHIAGQQLVAAPPPVERLATDDQRVHFDLGKTLDEVEREYILRTLRFSGNNRNRAARILNISRRTLYNRLARPEYDLAKPPTAVHSRVEGSGNRLPPSQRKRVEW